MTSLRNEPVVAGAASPEPASIPWGTLAIVALVFAPVLTFGFVRWDDPLHLLDNPLVRDPRSRPLLDHLLTPSLGYPTPLTVLSYRLEVALVGVEGPWLFHLTNLVLHLVSCGLMHTLARGLGASRRASTLAVVLFGLHPVVVEPVAWVSGRKDLLALVFALGCLVLRLGARRGSSRAAIGAFLCFALALAAKPVSAYVALLVLLEPWLLASISTSMTPAPSRGQRVLDATRVAAPYLATAAFAVVVAMVGQRRVGAVDPADPLPTYLREAWYALGHHLGLIAFVHEPTAKYLPAVWPAPFVPRVDLAPLVAVIVVAAMVRYLDPPRRPLARYALVFAVASYLPSSNLIPLVRYLADTYLYGPMVGIAWLVALAADRLVDRLGRPSPSHTSLLVGVVAIPFAMMVLPSEMRFRDSVSLWAHTYERNPHDHRLCQNLVVAHYDVDGPAAALAESERCIARFGPRHFEKNRAIALFRLGRLDEADAGFARAERNDPGDPVVRHYRRTIAASRSPRPR